MSFMATVRLALEALIRNKVRSLLTMLGIVIGVAAVIVTVAIGSGARTSVTNSINALGSNLIVVQPGSVTQGGARTGFGGASTLTPADGMAMTQLAGVAAVSPLVTVRTQVVAGGNNWQTTISGVAPTYTFIKGWPLASGTFFTDEDIASSAKVAVLGQTDVSELFPGGGDPIGQNIIVKGVPFTVIGTLTALGQSSLGTDQDDTILVPYTSAMQRLTGQTTVNQLMVSASSAALVNSSSDRGDATARTTPPHRRGTTRRFPSAQPAVDCSSRVVNRSGDGVFARRRCGGFVDRRRYRHHEHHDGLGYRAHA